MKTLKEYNLEIKNLRKRPLFLKNENSNVRYWDDKLAKVNLRVWQPVRIIYSQEGLDQSVNNVFWKTFHMVEQSINA